MVRRLTKIKSIKKMRIDELIKHIWDGALPEGWYESDEGLKRIVVYEDRVSFSNIDNNSVCKEDVFTVEIKEDITEDTVLPYLTYSSDDHMQVIAPYYSTIKGALGRYPNAKVLYALYNGKLEPVWIRDSNES